MEYIAYRMNYAIIPEDAVPADVQSKAREVALKYEREFKLPEIKIKWFVPLDSAASRALQVIDVLEGPVGAMYLTKHIPESSPAERASRKALENTVLVNALLDGAKLTDAVAHEARRVYMKTRYRRFWK